MSELPDRVIYKFKPNPVQEALYQKEKAEREARRQQAAKATNNNTGANQQSPFPAPSNPRPNQGMFPPSPSLPQDATGVETRKPSNMAKKTTKGPDPLSSGESLPTFAQLPPGSSTGFEKSFKPSPADSNSLLTMVPKEQKSENQGKPGISSPPTAEILTTGPSNTVSQPSQQVFPLPQTLVSKPQSLQPSLGATIPNNQSIPPSIFASNSNPSNIDQKGGLLMSQARAQHDVAIGQPADESENTHLLKMTVSQLIQHLSSKCNSILSSVRETAKTSLVLIDDQQDNIQVQKNLKQLGEYCQQDKLLKEVLELEKNQNEVIEELQKIEAKIDKGLGEHQLVGLHRQADFLFGQVEEIGLSGDIRSDGQDVWELSEVLRRLEEEAFRLDKSISECLHKMA